ncbi:effector-associated constant component EACC1 [Nocardia sp. CA-129566]|uniref:effector-associated constant component EACC1 n=1 Tax=Nocardia sp. CA-129566 TaxID=3239976 RepID=UPI003D99B8B8
MPEALVIDVVLDAEPDTDPNNLDQWTRQLRGELAQLDDVESAALAADSSVATGSKAGDPVSVGALMVVLAAPGGVLTTVVNTVRAWLASHSAVHRVSITIDGETIELDHATSSQQRELVELYVRRHAREPRRR